jgi:hypothetical protein
VARIPPRSGRRNGLPARRTVTGIRSGVLRVSPWGRPTFISRVQQGAERYFYRELPKKPKGKEPTREETREAITKVIEQFPQLLDYYIRDKEEHRDEASSVAKERVRLAELRFIEQVRAFVANYLEGGGFYAIPGNTYDDARRRPLFLKDVIENKGGHRIFYDAKGHPIQREEDLQILYRLTWFASPSDAIREANEGRGRPTTRLPEEQQTRPWWSSSLPRTPT